MASRRDATALAAADECRGVGDYRRTTCPFCVERMGSSDPHRAFWVSQVNGWYGCWRCGVKGRLPGFDDDTQYIPPPDETLAEQRRVGPPAGYEPILRVTTTTRDAVHYLTKRGISRATVIDVGIGVCNTGKYAGRVVVPCFALDGKTWLGWSARLYREPLGEWDRNYRTADGMDRAGIVFNLRALAGNSRTPVLCTEGVFDALPYYPNAVALLGKPSDGQVDLLASSRRPIVACLDGDSWREAEVLARRIRRRGKQDVGWVRLPPKRDPNTVCMDTLQRAALAAASGCGVEYASYATRVEQ